MIATKQLFGCMEIKTMTMNNYEKIKNMNIDEMANLFFFVKPKGCGFCEGQYMGCLRQAGCIQAIKEWLNGTKPPADYEKYSNKKWNGGSDGH